ncbi:hypothetical protein [Sporomusa sphaeroides]|uniref:Uncharacterized protein n=1 Tax=Sporomusa sphaeroides DSM 2875 TaxID=1337886 RepID=A0ABM9W3I6_9FIRM|nr:hypothetical protein [Sporomusa sphaeroides]MCM0759609.1 hypothetical protein [Sporomusa sphaeroides DSM 2875]OLS56366.1 hypothetical protein SPSPH_27590 [Sporomusa sphaeroides DSM 2875]CVK18461.1 hypothetical protein SSPH_01099 [Sporomusa sphaeroides DSM 2875]
MDILHMLLRIIVLAISIPFGLLAALIPGYAAGQIVAMIGLPAEIGYYLVGGLVLVVFCAYFQDRITPPKNA